MLANISPNLIWSDLTTLAFSSLVEFLFMEVMNNCPEFIAVDFTLDVQRYAFGVVGAWMSAGLFSSRSDTAPRHRPMTTKIWRMP